MTKTLIDLSHVIEEDMSVYPGTSSPLLKKIATHSEAGFNELELTFTTHTGTHIDAPAHLLADGKTLDMFPPESFYGRATVINCQQARSISRENIAAAIDPDRVPEFLLFHTGWDHYWKSSRYFLDFPVIDNEAADFLNSLPLKALGIDAPSFDSTEDNKLKNHRTFFARDMLLIENLCNLGKIAGEFTFCCMPLKILRSDGAPARAFAIQE